MDRVALLRLIERLTEKDAWIKSLLEERNALENQKIRLLELLRKCQSDDAEKDARISSLLDELDQEHAEKDKLLRKLKDCQMGFPIMGFPISG